MSGQTRRRWLYERPTITLLMAPAFVIIAIGWAYASSPINDLFIVWRAHTETEMSAAQYRMIGMWFAHPWLSLGVGLVWGFIFGLWDKRRTDKYLHLRASTICREAQGQRFASFFSSMPGAPIFWTFFLIPIVFIVAIPIAAKPFLFAEAAVFLAIVSRAERRAFSIAESRLDGEPMDDVTRKRVERWLHGQNAPIGIAVLAIVTITITAMQIQLGHQTRSISEELKSASLDRSTAHAVGDGPESASDDR